ncbi:MAG: MFS transporter [Bacteroidales bacterium]|nr:MFS transporter [Bacteroidales bacterium]
MKEKLNLTSNRVKFILHGFFFSTAYHMAEPSTILPLVVNHFSKSNIIIGLISSLVRGGAIIMQMFMAFHAQAYKHVMRPLRLLFFFRVLSWIGTGLAIFFFGKANPLLALWLFGTGLFLFSFTAGLGTILFHELLGKIFTGEYRGVTWAYRQISMGAGGILSGFIAGWILNYFPKPLNFAYSFLISSIFLITGYVIISTVKEWGKRNVAVKEKSFSVFIRNSMQMLKEDRQLRNQIIACILSYSYLFALPFVVKYIKLDLNLGGLAIGSAVPLLTGAMVGNIVWAKLASKNANKQIVTISFILMIISLGLAFIPSSLFLFVLIFLLAGSASDGFRLAFKNMVLNLATEEKRPVYFALQNFITSLGLFFSIPGGALINLIGFNGLLIFTVALLITGLWFGRFLKNV